MRLATGISSLESDRSDALADAVGAAIARNDVGNACEANCLCQLDSTTAIGLQA